MAGYSLKPKHIRLESQKLEKEKSKREWEILQKVIGFGWVGKQCPFELQRQRFFPSPPIPIIVCSSSLSLAFLCLDLSPTLPSSFKVILMDIMESNSQQPGKGAAFLRTCFHGINALSGILSIPYALSEAGWLSLIILLLTAIVCYYTGLLLRRCMKADILIKTYPDIGELAFGSKGRTIVSTFMYLELYMVAVEFLILEGDNLFKLFPNSDFHIFSKEIGGKQCFVLLTAIVILPKTWLRNLGVLAYVSACGVMVWPHLFCFSLFCGLLPVMV